MSTERTLTITEGSIVVIRTPGEINFGGGPQRQQLVIRELANHQQIDPNDARFFQDPPGMHHEHNGKVQKITSAMQLGNYADIVFPANATGWQLGEHKSYWRTVYDETVPTLPLEMLVVSALHADAQVLDIIKVMHDGQVVDARDRSLYPCIASVQTSETTGMHDMLYFPEQWPTYIGQRFAPITNFTFADPSSDMGAAILIYQPQKHAIKTPEFIKIVKANDES